MAFLRRALDMFLNLREWTISVGSITIGNLGIAMLEPSLPLWMMDTMHAGSATRGRPSFYRFCLHYCSDMPLQVLRFCHVLLLT